MRADICEPGDLERLERFRSALKELGAEATDDFMAYGVNLITMSVSGQTLSVFSDPWSIDVDGPDDIVAQLLQKLSDSQSRMAH